MSSVCSIAHVGELLIGSVPKGSWPALAWADGEVDQDIVLREPYLGD